MSNVQAPFVFSRGEATLFLSALKSESAVVLASSRLLCRAQYDTWGLGTKRACFGGAAQSRIACRVLRSVPAKPVGHALYAGLVPCVRVSIFHDAAPGPVRR